MNHLLHQLQIAPLFDRHYHDRCGSRFSRAARGSCDGTAHRTVKFAFPGAGLVARRGVGTTALNGSLAQSEGVTLALLR